MDVGSNHELIPCFAAVNTNHVSKASDAGLVDVIDVSIFDIGF